MATTTRRGNAPARLGPAMIAGAITLLGLTATGRAGLDDYVKKPDPAFAWSLVGNDSTPAGTYTELKLTSQVWKGITWTHSLIVYEPKAVAPSDAMLLFITGGSTGGKVDLDDHKLAFGVARACGVRVAFLRQVPNQPLLGDKKEDELIAETFVRFLDTGDEEWPLLFPMTKSAVRAMDALQSWAKTKNQPVTRFVVTGGSSAAGPPG